jgi:nitrogen fixation NifU-like protein
MDGGGEVGLGREAPFFCIIMDRQQHIEKLMEHFEAPHHCGALPDAEVIHQGGNPSCGDIITVYLKIDEDRAMQVQFEGEGCTISQAAASILMDQVQGKTLAEIESLDYNDLIEELGRDIVMTRVRCATLGLMTLKNAVQTYHSSKLQGSKVAK